jgi:hypothetical protein
MTATHQSLTSDPNAPFLVIGLRQFSHSETEQAVEDFRSVSAGYDPITQTSIIPSYAGSAKTYRSTSSWQPGPVTDDEKVDDY